jgi:hypothetical protein
LASGAEGCSVVAARPCNSNRTHATTKEKHMEYAPAEEAWDMGEYADVDAEFFVSVCDLFDMYQPEYSAYQPQDYLALTEGTYEVAVAEM